MWNNTGMAIIKSGCADHVHYTFIYFKNKSLLPQNIAAHSELNHFNYYCTCIIPLF